MMGERKNYSKRREKEIYAIIHEQLIQVRMDMLRSGYAGMNGKYQEERFFEATKNLGENVCAEYRKKYTGKI